MKKIFFWILLFIILLSSIELFSWVALRYLKRKEGTTQALSAVHELPEDHKKTVVKLLNDEFEYYRFDPDLGWVIKGNGEKGIYRANSQGIRSNHEYSREREEGKLRIAAFGDSFTHGDEADNSETWQAQMEAASPQLEVINFGVPGYGPGQAYLHYLRNGVNYSPDIVLIGLTMPMMFRSVGIYNPFQAKESQLKLGKPRFILEDDQLKLISNPFQSLKDYQDLLEGKHDFEKSEKYDYSYRRLFQKSFWDISASVRLFKMVKGKIDKAQIAEQKLFFTELNPDTEAARVTAKICEQFYQDVLRNGSKPVIVIFPQGTNIISWLKYGREQMKPFISYLEERNLEYIHLIDMFDDIETQRLKEYFAPGKHYSSKGNAVCAKKILEYLAIKGYINGTLMP